MKNVLLNIFYLAVIPAFLGFSLYACIATNYKPPTKGKHYRTFSLNTGVQVYCEDAEEKECGVILSNCSDGNAYLCQTNLQEAK